VEPFVDASRCLWGKSPIMSLLVCELRAENQLSSDQDGAGGDGNNRVRSAVDTHVRAFGPQKMSYN